MLGGRRHTGNWEMSPMEMHIDDTEDECKMTDVEVEDDLNLSSFKELVKRQQHPAPLILSSSTKGRRHLPTTPGAGKRKRWRPA